MPKLRLPSPISCIGIPCSLDLETLSFLGCALIFDGIDLPKKRLKGAFFFNLSKIVFTLTTDCLAEHRILRWKLIFLRLLVTCFLSFKTFAKIYCANLFPIIHAVVFQHFLFNPRVLKCYEDFLYKGLLSFTVLGTQRTFSNGRFIFQNLDLCFLSYKIVLKSLFC